MSTFKHPVGPQPSSVYWRRRLVLALGLIAVIVVIVLIVVRPGASSGEPRPATTGTSTPTPKHPAAAAPTSIPTAHTTATGQPCDPADIQVQAVTDASSYAAGALPQLSVAVTNTGATACKIDAGTAQQVFTITSGSETYWKSTDCQTSKVDAEVLLQPGKTISSASPITWDRTRSDPATCAGARQQVPAGGASYHLQTSIAGITSSQTKQFILN